MILISKIVQIINILFSENNVIYENEYKNYIIIFKSLNDKYEFIKVIQDYVYRKNLLIKFTDDKLFDYCFEEQNVNRISMI